MTKNYRHYTWFIWSILLSLAFVLILQIPYTIPANFMNLAYVLLFVGWLFPIMRIVLSKQVDIIAHPLRKLRTTYSLLTVVITIEILFVCLFLWAFVSAAEYDFFLLLSCFFLCSILWFIGNKEEDWRTISKKLSYTRWTNILILISALMLSFASLELFMRWTMVESHSFGVTLQSKEWFARYFQPINSLGYRGYEPVQKEENETSILVLGDSFVVGHGIRNVDDVFAYQLDQILGKDYIVNLAGKPGLSPTVNYVKNYPYQPDILILSHFVNDIDHTIEGKTFSAPSLNPFMTWLTKSYFIPSFAYWNVYIARQSIDEYNNNVLMPYENEAQWAKHAEQLQEFVDWAKENDKQLIVLIWPTLDKLEASQFSNSKVANFFEEQHVPVILMSQYLENLSVPERTIDRLDAHPSEVAHRIAAEALADVVEQLEGKSEK